MVRGTGEKNIHIPFTYAKPNPMVKEAFWRDCIMYANSVDDPCFIVRDFNDIAIDEKQWDSERVNPNVMAKFVVAFNSCGLFDLEST